MHLLYALCPSMALLGSFPGKPLLCVAITIGENLTLT